MYHKFLKTKVYWLVAALILVLVLGFSFLKRTIPELTTGVTHTDNRIVSRPGFSELDSAARVKIDPLLQSVLEAAVTDQPDNARLKSLSQLIELRTVDGKVEVGVLVSGSVTETQLEMVGLAVSGRIGEIVAGRILVTSLSELAALPEVERIEASRIHQIE